MRPFFITVACTWIALLGTAFFYSQQHPDFHWIWTAALPAFLLETLFYLGSVFENTRAAFNAAFPDSRTKSIVLWFSALLPYLIFALSARTFLPNAFYLLAGLTAVLAFWHTVFPRRLAYDIGFLVIAAIPFITRIFGRLYRSPDNHIRVDVLGHLMWIRLGILALLLLREWDAGPVSLWPTRREWKAGAIWFVAGILPVSVVALALHSVHFVPVASLTAASWWRSVGIAIGTFVGAFSVLTLGEELLFRGVIERAVLDYSGSTMAAVAISSLLFGGSHLWFNHFPNWPWVVVTTVLGIFCGLAYVQTGSIRASMVTHSLTIVVWRVLLVQ
jgi:membrane protease YdiL (CAAX protease family)